MIKASWKCLNGDSFLKHKTEFSQEELNEMTAIINQVFQHYYKMVNHSLLKASDFHVPWFIKRKERLSEFEDQYAPLSVAMLVEAIRGATTKQFGSPEEMLMEQMRKKLLSVDRQKSFDSYWRLIQEENAKQNDTIRPLVSGLSTLFMYKLFGPEATDPNPAVLNSTRHQVAVDFQIGRYLFSLIQGVEKGLDHLQKQNKIKKKKTSNTKDTTVASKKN